VPVDYQNGIDTGLSVRPIDVLWIHGNEDFPISLVSEVDDDGYETRKVEFFRSGEVGFACASKERGGTSLGSVPIPSLNEINSSAEFRGSDISSEHLDMIWGKYVPSNS